MPPYLSSSRFRLWLTLAVCILHSGALAQEQDFIPGALYIKTVGSYQLPLDKNYPPFSNGMLSLQDFGVTAIEPAFKRLSEDTVLNKIFLLTADQPGKLELLMKHLNELPYIEYAERIPVYYTSLTPNDMQPAQWHLPKINAEAAWNVTTGGNNVLVAIIDDAIRLTHEDLAPNIWTNTGEIPNNNIDDDLNGYIDDIHGWDVANNDNDPNPPLDTVALHYLTQFTHYFTHGTHCAGIAAAATGNNKGIASISYNVQILPVKAKRDYTGGASLQASLEGLEYAIYMDADIISMSFGSYTYSFTMEHLIKRGHQDGIVFFAAAGNNNIDIPIYPASYEHVISVGATDANDQKAFFSNYGPMVDVMAPGVQIVSAIVKDDVSYDDLNGTSMACPLAAGLGALLLSHSPYLTPDELELILKQTAVNIDSLNPLYTGQLGAGRINAYEAVRQLKPLTARFVSDYTFICTGDAVQFTQQSTNTPTAWRWSFPGGTPAVSVQPNPVVTYAVPGTFDVTLIASNATGIDTILMSGYITAGVPTATLSGTQTIHLGSAAYLRIDFTGNPPFTFTYTDGTNNYTIANVNENPLILNVPAVQNNSYSLVSFADVNCSGIVSGTAMVTIDPNPPPCGFVREIHIAPTPNIQSDFSSIAAVGDIDGNGVADLAFGNAFDNYGATSIGAVYILFLEADGSISSTRKIGHLAGNLPNVLSSHDEFGYGIARVGDLNGDGIDEIAVGASGDDQAGTGAGAIYIMYLDSNATVRHLKKILAPEPSANTRGFGLRVAGMGDLDKDGVPDLIASTEVQPDGNGNPVEIDELYILFLKPDGSLKRYIEYNTSAWYLQNVNFFNQAQTLANAGDIDGNGVNDFITDAKILTPNGLSATRVRLFFLDSIGAVIDTASFGPFNAPGINNHFFGRWASGIGDIDLDGVPDLAVPDFFPNGAPLTGRLFITFMNSDGSVKSFQELSNGNGGIPNNFFPANETFGLFPIAIGDIDRNGGLNFCTTSQGVMSNNRYFHMMDLTDCSGNSCTLHADFQYGGTGCLNYPVQFFDQSGVSTPYQIDRWEWDFGNGATSQLQNPEHTYSNAGTYSVRLIVTSVQNLCVDTIIKQVIIQDNFALTGANSVDVCVGDSIALPLQTICGVEPVHYAWAGLSSNEQNPFVTVTATTTYSVTATNGTGEIAIKSITVIADSLCCASKAQITQLASNNCYNQTIQFVNNSTAQGNATYRWKFGNDANPRAYNGTNPPAVTYDTTGLFEVTLILQDACGMDSVTHQFLIFEKPELGLRDTVACGDSVQVGLPPLSGFDYLWVPAVGVSDPFASNPWIKYTRSYILSAKDAWTGCEIKDTIDVSFDSLTITGPSSFTICAGDSVELSPWIISCDLEPLQFSWSGIPGNMRNPVVKPLTTTTYQLTVTNALGFTATKSVSVLVDTNCCPFSAAFIPVNHLDCYSDTATFLNISNAHPGATYYWDFGATATPASFTGENPPPVIYSSGGATQVILTLHDSCGTDVTVFNFDVPEKPNLGLNDTTFCFLDSVSVGITASPDFAYRWSPAQGISNPNISNPWISNAGVYVLVATDTVAQCVTVDTVILTTDSSCCNSQAGITHLEHCYSDTVQFISSSITQPGASYNWTFGPAASPSSFTGEKPPPVAFASNTTVLQATLVIDDVCGTDTAVHHFQIPEPPDLQLRDTTICIEDSVQVNSALLPDFIYAWNPSPGISDTSVSNPWIKNAGIYILTATDTVTGCEIKDTIEVTTSDPEIDTMSGFTYSRNGFSVAFADTITAPHASLWNFGDNSAPSALTNPLYTYAEAGNYKVCLSIGSCVPFTTCQTISIITGISALPLDFMMELYPNPALNELMVLPGVPLDQPQFTVFNSIGQIMPVVAAQNGQAYRLNLEKISAGLYYLKLTDNDKVIIKNFVKSE